MTPHSPGGGGGGGQGGHGGQSLLTRPLPKTLNQVVFYRITPRVPDPRSLGDGRDSERFGYNDDSPWQPEPSYTRWVQPMESELAKQVEYDMDEVDLEWLNQVNAERRAENLESISFEMFEIVMDKLEKEWFDLQKHIPKPESSLPAEDSKCAICDDGECENSNAIVFCDGCNLAVHQDCYGVPYIPEGQWLCRKCTVSPDRPVSCILCPAEFGAFKQTTNGKWAHLVCAIWINETHVSNVVYMEPVDGIDAIPRSRWKLVCYLCKKRTGACIQCSKSTCYQAYHVTCAREYGLYMKMGTSSGTTHDGPAANVSYCLKHSRSKTGGGSADAEREMSEELPTIAPNNRKRKLMSYDERHRSTESSTPQPEPIPKPQQNGMGGSNSKQSRAYGKAFTGGGPPIIPQYIFDKVYDYVKPIQIRNKKKQFINQVCRYWSLKRDSRRGAPLLKRLHLEPWTAAGVSQQATDLEKEKKLELIALLRHDLEKVRTLTELVRKREREKLRRSQLLKSIIESVIFPQTAVFRNALKRIQSLDSRNLFLHPVSRIEVPDYHTLILHPMDWMTISEKLEANSYLTANEFQSDVRLVISNALLYNPAETPHAKAALKLRNNVEPILGSLNGLNERGNLTHDLHQEVVHLLDEETLTDMFRLFYPKPETPTPVSTVQAESAVEGQQDSLQAPMAIEPTPTQAQAQASSSTKIRIFQSNKRKANEIAGASVNGDAASRPTPKTEKERKREENARYGVKKKAKLLEDKAAAERATAMAVGKAQVAAEGPSQPPDDPRQTAPAQGVSTEAGPADPSAPPPIQQVETFVAVANGTESVEQAVRDAEKATLEATAADQALEEALDAAQQDAGGFGPEDVIAAREVAAEAAQKATEAEAKAVRVTDASKDHIINEWGAQVDDREQVTDHDSYLLFNSGWILAEGSKRRRRSASKPSISPQLGKSALPPAPKLSRSPQRKTMDLPPPPPSASPSHLHPEPVASRNELPHTGILQGAEEDTKPPLIPLPNGNDNALSATLDTSDLSDIDDEDEVDVNTLINAKSGASQLQPPPTPSGEAIIPAKDTPKARNSTSRNGRGRASSSATPLSSLAPARTRNMLAAEAALLHGTGFGDSDADDTLEISTERPKRKSKRRDASSATKEDVENTSIRLMRSHSRETTSAKPVSKPRSSRRSRPSVSTEPTESARSLSLTPQPSSRHRGASSSRLRGRRSVAKREEDEDGYENEDTAAADQEEGDEGLIPLEKGEPGTVQYATIDGFTYTIPVDPGVPEDRPHLQTLVKMAPEVYIPGVKRLKDGDGVWAKQTGKPVAVGEVCLNTDDREIPEEIIEACPEGAYFVNGPGRPRLQSSDPHLLIGFWPRRSLGWAWVPLSHCMKLRANKEYDRLLQSRYLLPENQKHLANSVKNSLASSKLFLETDDEEDNGRSDGARK